MEKIEREIKCCQKCGALPKPNCDSVKIGKKNIMVVGESPAKNGWLVSGKAFYDVNGKLQATGKVLEKLLNLKGLSIEDIYFTECCKCNVSDRSRLEECTTNCREFLLKQIEKSPCEIILTMGVFASQVVLNQKIKAFKDFVGKEFKIAFGLKIKKVIPIYHPSPINPKGFAQNKEIFLGFDF